MGTISAESMIVNSVFRPGKRRREKAYPAIEQVTSCPETTPADTSALLMKYFQKNGTRRKPARSCLCESPSATTLVAE